jgi:hypothetical protein
VAIGAWAAARLAMRVVLASRVRSVIGSFILVLPRSGF